MLHEHQRDAAFKADAWNTSRYELAHRPPPPEANYVRKVAITSGRSPFRQSTTRDHPHRMRLRRGLGYGLS